jgi:uncharacterized protein YjbI with pentapeptide repeats
MDISDSYLQQIHQLITTIIPFHICRYYSIIPISYLENNSSYILVAMVEPKNLIVEDTLTKILNRKNLKYQKLLISEYDYQRLLDLYEKYVLKINQNQKIEKCLQNLDYQNTLQSQVKIFNFHSLTPKPYDLVLGGNSHSPKINSLVLGGKEAIVSRFNSKNLAGKINALHESVKYEDLALKLLDQILNQERGILIWIAYSLLQNIAHPEAKKLSLKYQLKRQQENLKGANLQGLNLKGIDLEKANLSNVNFQGTLINEDTKIEPKWLLVWKIVNQGLDNENLSQIQFNETVLKESHLKNVVFRKALFSLVNLDRAKLTAIDFSHATLNHVNLDKANLNDLNIQEALFDRVSLCETNLNQINFSKSHLQEVNFTESTLTEVDFSYANLNHVSFCKANLRGVNFQNATFNQVNFSKAILHNVDMSYLNLSNLKLNLSTLDLRYSKFIRTNLTGINLSNANLSKANLSGANLSDANLENANLNGTKLILATYNKNTIFPNKFNAKRVGAIYC